MTRLEVRNIPAALIAGYLVDELGGSDGESTLRGPGWIVSLVTGEPAAVGRLRVPVLFIDISGEREAEVVRFLRFKTMRGGG